MSNGIVVTRRRCIRRRESTALVRGCCLLEKRRELEERVARAERNGMERTGEGERRGAGFWAAPREVWPETSAEG
jgi:hypothetical protein